jgi:hypothetical protein
MAAGISTSTHQQLAGCAIPQRFDCWQKGQVVLSMLSILIVIL